MHVCWTTCPVQHFAVEENMDPQVHDEVAAVRENAVAQRSRQIYRSSTYRFLEWLLHNRRDLLTADFTSAMEIDNDTPCIDRIKRIVTEGAILPIRFGDMQAKDFIYWLLTLRRRDGGRPGYSTYNSHRSALFNMYRDYAVLMNKPLETELKHHFVG